MTTQHHSYRARWVFPVDAEPIENCTIEVIDGRIADVHTRHNSAACDLGNVAIIPGLVNAHTHLEFSDIRQPIQPAQPFTDWIRAVVAHRRNQTADINNTIAAGYRECAEAGTTLIGEIATAADSTDVMRSSGPRVVLFRELLGLPAESIEQQLSIARRHLENRSHPDNPPNIVRGISPHAPYSVHPELFSQLVDLAAKFDAPLAIHLAETEAELELLADGTGEFVDLLKGFGVWQDGIIPQGRKPFDYLETLAKLGSALVIHGNYLSTEEIAFLAKHRNITVVYCPRTHAWFGHQNHPWQKMLAAGVSLAVGTDSRASNPNLSLWQELTFLRQQHPEFDARQLLELGTIAGAQAFGIEDEVGTLTVGKSADITVLSLSATEASAPYSLLFDGQNQVIAAMSRGQWIHGPLP